jgi:hypothetical protein
MPTVKILLVLYCFALAGCTLEERRATADGAIRYVENTPPPEGPVGAIVYLIGLAAAAGSSYVAFKFGSKKGTARAAALALSEGEDQIGGTA